MWSVLRDSTGQFPVMVKFSKERLPHSSGLLVPWLWSSEWYWPHVELQAWKLKKLQRLGGMLTLPCLYFKALILPFFFQNGHVMMYEQILNSWHLASTFPVPRPGSALGDTTLSNQDQQQCPAHGEGSINLSGMNELCTTRICWTCCFEPCSSAVKMYWEGGEGDGV